LSREGADVLLHNALILDEIFRGETEKVLSIIKNDFAKNKLEGELDKAQGDIEQRFQTYAYWNEQFPAVRKVLTDHFTDLTRESLNDKLKNLPQTISVDKPLPFGLRAIQRLETIEERGQLRKKTADEYAEQADAYMALGDSEMATANAIRSPEN
jgi:hypothetical protein